MFKKLIMELKRLNDNLEKLQPGTVKVYITNNEIQKESDIKYITSKIVDKLRLAGVKI